MYAVAALVSGFVVTACSGEKVYDVTFTCTSTGGAACPAKQPCPTVPLGSGGAPSAAKPSWTCPI